MNIILLGINSMAVSVVDCWETASEWLLNENVGYTPCRHMGHLYSPQLYKIKSMHYKSSFFGLISRFPRYFNSWFKIPHLLDTGTLELQDILLKRTWKEYLNLSIMHISKLIDNQISIFKKKPKKLCNSLKNQNNSIIVSRIEYSMLGDSLVLGDFNGTGRPQIVISAPGYSNASFSMNGAVFIMEAKTYNAQEYFIEDIGTKIEGPAENGAMFGNSIVFLSIINSGCS